MATEAAARFHWESIVAQDRTRTPTGAPANGPALNWREIDRVLVELDLKGAFIRDVAQTGPATLLFSLHRPAAPQRGIGPGRLTLLCRLAGGSRLHRTAEPFPAGRARPSRFVTFLRAHVRNSRIDSALQLGTERIVRIRCGAAARRRIIWLRLWSGASNCVVTDDRGTILETLFRRPQRGETAGSRFAPPVQVGGRDPQRYRLRPLAGAGDYNARLDAHYRSRERIARAVTDAHAACIRFERERRRRAIRIARLRAALRHAADYQAMRAAGQTILANAHLLDRSVSRLPSADGGAEITLNPQWSPADNASRYFREYRRRRAAVERLQTELAAGQRHWQAFRALGPVVSAPDAGAASKPASRHSSGGAAGGPGTLFASAGWVLRVGRSAIASDAILRHAAGGNDYWFHCRDHPGAHVFLSARRGRNPPLPVLLDAATLAVFFSKARRNGHADVHYTQVRNLRRVKGGEPGAVVPMHEKNLFVRLERARLRRLLGRAGSGGDAGAEQAVPAPGQPRHPL